jgi:phospholipase/carboxylesterase
MSRSEPLVVIDSETGLSYLSRAAAEPCAAPALLVMLHGVGSNERNLWPLTAVLDPRFHAISLRSAFQHGPDAYGWYRVSFTPTGPMIDGHEALSSLALLTRFLAALPARYQLPAQRIYLFGFSQGCSMAYSVALTRPALIGGWVGLGGRILPQVQTEAVPQERLAHLSAFIAHGSEDPVIPVASARAARDFLTQASVSLRYREYPAGHLIAQVARDDAFAWLTETAFASTQYSAA